MRMRDLRKSDAETRRRGESRGLISYCSAPLRLRVPLAFLLCLAGTAGAQTDTDYSKGAPLYPIYKSYTPLHIPEPNLANAENAPFEVHDGKLRLSMDQLARLVVENNLTVAAARYYPSMAQTDLLRARSGASPRGVDASVIPSGVFAGAEGGSILSSAGGGGGGSSNPGGITGSASAVRVSPSGVFDPAVRFSFSLDRPPAR